MFCDGLPFNKRNKLKGSLMHITLTVILLTGCMTILVACGGGRLYSDGDNVYEAAAEGYVPPSVHALAVEGTHQAFATGLPCDQLKVEMNTLGREMGKLAVHMRISPGNPDNFGMASLMMRISTQSRSEEALGLNKDEMKQLNRYMDEYKSLRHSAYVQQCPFTSQLDDAEIWADKEYNSGLRTFSRTVDTMESIHNLVKEAEDW